LGSLGRAGVFSFFLIVSVLILISFNYQYVFAAPGDTIEFVDASLSDLGQYTSIAIGSDGNPVISYYAVGGALKFVHCTSVDCSTNDSPIVLDSTGDVGQYTSIAIGSDTFPVISYHDVTNLNLKFVHCKNVTCFGSEGVGFDTPITIDNTSIVGLHTSIAIGTDDFPIISYADNAIGELKVAHCNNVSCSNTPDITVVTSSISGARFTSIAIGTDNNPIISFQIIESGGEDLAVTHCTNVSCTMFDTVEILDNDDRTGWYTSLAIGSDNNPVISYQVLQTPSTQRDLRVVHCNDIFCSDFNVPVTLDNDQQVGVNTSIAIGSDNFPIISHHDLTDRVVRISHCKNITCGSFDEPVIIDFGSLNSVGQYTSIAIGSDNLPVISYYDIGNGDLKVAHCSTVNCSTFNPTSCIVPSSGPWVVSQSCILYSTFDMLDDVTITMDSLLTIEDGVTLGFDFKLFSITVESGSGILIKSGGIIKFRD